jgi:hypothetical protein
MGLRIFGRIYKNRNQNNVVSDHSLSPVLDQWLFAESQ